MLKKYRFIIGLVVALVVLVAISWQLLGAYSLLLASGLAVWSLVENAWLKVAYLKITSPKLHQAYRIIQISDFHNNAWVLQQIMRAIRRHQPDLVVLTGDIFNGEQKNNPASARLLKQLSQLDVPVAIIYGNHETDLRTCRQEIFDWQHDRIIAQGKIFKSVKRQTPNNILHLHNQTLRLNSLTISGVDYGHQIINFREHHGIDTASFNLLLIHTPEEAKLYTEQGFDLALCGHHHGGQIRLPLIGAIINAERYLFSDQRGRPTRGLSQVQNSLIYIDSGSGWGGLPLRFLCRVQISLIELSP